MGSQTQTAIDIDAIVAADNKLNADKIYFVHNHPSGYIVCSQADKSVFSDIKKRVGDKLQDGIIINTTRGVFGTFNDHTSTVEHEYADIDGANPIKTYSFDTQVFAPGYVPIIHQAGSAEDVVTFICSHRLGDRSKISVLIANNTLSIVGNVFTPFTEIDNDNYKDVVRFAVDNALLMGGRSVFLYGDFKNNSDYSLKKEFEKYNIRLNDIITIKGNNSNYYQSGFDDGGLFEPETAYGRTERAGRTALDPKAQITIVEARDNEFSNFDEAREWAKKNIARTYSNEETGGKGEIQISNNAINKYLSESSVDKSDSKDVHLSVLKVLPDVIRESIDAEQHPDYNKKDGVRKPENGANPNVTIHRLYGAVRIGRSTFRVKVTLKEHIDKNQPNVPHSYEATKIELLAGTLVDAESTDPNTNNSISVANLLNGVEKSYGKGEKIIENPRIEEEKDVLLMEAVDYHRAMAKDSYEREVSSTTSKFNEAWVDSMASLKTLQDSVAEATGKPIRDFENAYLAENRMSSSNLAEIEEYRRTLFKAITDEVNVLVSKGLKYDDLIDYLMAKHGLERNEVLAIRDAEAKIADKVSELEKRKKKREISTEKFNEALAKLQNEELQKLIEENRKRDYSGLTALFAEAFDPGHKPTTQELEEKAKQFVNEVESNFDTQNLWDAINAATKETLKKQFDSGMIDAETYKKIRDMFKFYVPLRGFDEVTSDEVYSYFGNKNGEFGGTIKKWRFQLKLKNSCNLDCRSSYI